jgi:hypothetical protein
MADSVPVPPVELTNGVIVNSGDSASTEAAKLRFQGEIDSLTTQGIINSLTVYTDGSKSFGGVPT